MKKFETQSVRHIVVRNSYISNNEFIKPDEEGDLINFGEKLTNEIVKEIVILVNPKMELKEISRLLLKVVNEIENKLNHEQK